MRAALRLRILASIWTANQQQGTKFMARYGIDGKKTKIVATIGPGSSNKETLRAMVRAGLDVARINFSHGDHEAHAKTIDTVREVAAEEGTVVAILADIQGPKIRLGQLVEPIPVKAGDQIEFTLDSVDGSNGKVNLPHPEFMQDLQAGMPLLYGDGELQFTILSKSGTRSLVAEAEVDGLIESRKGMMAPTAPTYTFCNHRKRQSRYCIRADQRPRLPCALVRA
jgi:pyruvate kinase